MSEERKHVLYAVLIIVVVITLMLMGRESSNDPMPYEDRPIRIWNFE